MIVRVRSAASRWETVIEVTDGQALAAFGEDASQLSDGYTVDGNRLATQSAKLLRQRGLRARSVRGEVVVEADAGGGS